MTRIRVAVLAQDLIWSDRLARAVEAAGAEPARSKTVLEFDQDLVDASFAIIDLTARNYEPMAAIERARVAGARVVAIGPHDDVATRKRALAAGAERVFAYRKLHEDGPATIAAWMARSEPRPVETPA
jgi:hypothetical protein